jgi:addiction module RelB/DinJ family antitoxin
MNTTIRVTVDPMVKQQAIAVLKHQGLTLSEAIRKFLSYVGTTPTELPFLATPSQPNATTLKAVEATRHGEGLETVTLEQLEKEWHEP